MNRKILFYVIIDSLSICMAIIGLGIGLRIGSVSVVFMTLNSMWIVTMFFKFSTFYIRNFFNLTLKFYPIYALYSIPIYLEFLISGLFVIMYYINLAPHCDSNKIACSTNLASWILFLIVSTIDFLVYVIYDNNQVDTGNNPANTDNNQVDAENNQVDTENNLLIDFHDILRENDNPKNPVPTVIERSHTIKISRESGNNNINEIIPIETHTGNDDIITLDQ